MEFNENYTLDDVKYIYNEISMRLIENEKIYMELFDCSQTCKNKKLIKTMNKLQKCIEEDVKIKKELRDKYGL